MSDQRRKPSRQGNKRDELHPGFDVHLLEHVDDVLGADVAGRTGRKRTSAQTAQRSIEAHGTALVGGEDIGEPHPARVVEVERQFNIAEARSEPFY